MKSKEFFNYESPSVEIVEVEVESGFAGSFGGEDSNVTNGSWNAE